MTRFVLAAVLCFATASAQAGTFFLYDNYGNNIIGQQNAYGGFLSDNWGRAVYWSGNQPPFYPQFQPPIQFNYRPVYAPQRSWHRGF